MIPGKNLQTTSYLLEVESEKTQRPENLNKALSKTEKQRSPAGQPRLSLAKPCQRRKSNARGLFYLTANFLFELFETLGTGVRASSQTRAGTHERWTTGEIEAEEVLPWKFRNFRIQRGHGVRPRMRGGEG